MDNINYIPDVMSKFDCYQLDKQKTHRLQLTVNDAYAEYLMSSLQLINHLDHMKEKYRGVYDT